MMEVSGPDISATGIRPEVGSSAVEAANIIASALKDHGFVIIKGEKRPADSQETPAYKVSCLAFQFEPLSLTTKYSVFRPLSPNKSAP